MGTDDLFHKRKARSAKDLRRRKAKRKPYDKVLIICEGEKTEPNYFNELISFYEINSANVVLDGDCGSSPKSIYEHGLKLYEVENLRGDPFDKVFFVFDKDSHGTYEQTMREISLKKPDRVFTAINSIPCFEYWLLLHFKYSNKPFVATGSSSICSEVIKELLKFLPEYSKGMEKLFSQLHDQLDFAKNNAIRAERFAHENHIDNPSTYIHYLVEFLQKIKHD